MIIFKRSLPIKFITTLVLVSVTVLYGLGCDKSKSASSTASENNSVEPSSLQGIDKKVAESLTDSKKNSQPEPLKPLGPWKEKLRLAEGELLLLKPRKEGRGVVLMLDDTAHAYKKWEPIIAQLRANSPLGLVVPAFAYQEAGLSKIIELLKSKGHNQIGVLYTGKNPKALLKELDGLPAIKTLAFVSPVSQDVSDFGTKMLKNKRPTFLLAGADDAASAKIIKSLKSATQNFDYKLVQGAKSRGVELLKENPQELRLLQLFLARQL